MTNAALLMLDRHIPKIAEKHNLPDKCKGRDFLALIRLAASDTTVAHLEYLFDVNNAVNTGDFRSDCDTLIYHATILHDAY